MSVDGDDEVLELGCLFYANRWSDCFVISHSTARLGFGIHHGRWGTHSTLSVTSGASCVVSNDFCQLPSDNYKQFATEKRQYF